MVRQPDEVFSTLTSLWKRGRTFQIVVRGEAWHAPELDRSALTDYERLQLLSRCLVQQMPGAAKFCLAFRGMMSAQILTTARHFLHWPSLGSQLDKVPRQL